MAALFGRCVMVVMAFWCLAASAAPAASSHLVLAYSPLPPWKVVDAHGQPSGPYLDIVRLLARRVGLPLKVEVCPLMRCLELLRRGEADLAIGIAPGPGRDEYVDFLQPPFAEGSAIGFYRRRGDRVSVAHYGELHGLRIGVTAGAHYFPHFDQDASLVKDVAPDKLSNLRKLLAGRVDVVAMVCGEADVLFRRPEFTDKFRLAGPPVQTGPRSIVLAHASHYYSAKPRFEQALRQLVQSGEIRRLLRPVEH